MATSKLLIPVRKYRASGGAFKLPDKPVLASVRDADMLPLRQLAADVKRSFGSIARFARDAVSPAAVRIRRDRAIGGRDAYRLIVRPDGVEILAADDPGAYYGVQTLRDLLKAHGRSLPLCRIDDEPDFARRGVYHDCSRGKVPTVETIKALVERLAHRKINELQLYVENVFTFKRHPAIGGGYSPFTVEDILEIQAFCKRHHVALVGSLASFGHMEKILQLPQYVHLAELPGQHGWRGGTTLNPLHPGSIRLVADLFDEYLPIHEAVDFNVCCDETWELGKGRSKKRAEAVGTGTVYLEFLLKIHKLCCKHGKRMNAWADIVLEHPELLGRLPKDVVMLNWSYAPSGGRIPRTADIVRAGLPVVICPGTNAWQSHGSRLQDAIDNVANFSAVGRRHHAEGLLNTDWGDAGHRNLLGVSLHGFAHGAAHAWNGRAVDNQTFTDLFCRRMFAQRDGSLAAALRKLGSTYVTSGAPAQYGGCLYHALVEPLKPRRKPASSSIDQITPGGCRRIISQLSDPGIWPPPPKGMDRFERLAIREMAMGARMDCLAAARALAALKLRAGKAVAAAELRRLAVEMRRLAADFKRLWLARNRPSRLADNLALMRRAERECLRLAKA